MWEIVFSNVSVQGFEVEQMECALCVKVLMTLYLADKWRRYVDDTCVMQDQLHKDEFLNHINSVDNAIQFTAEEANEDDSIPS